MDAIKDAVAKADPNAAGVKIDAKWVYAIDADDVDAKDLERASTLLNASGKLDKADFYKSLYLLAFKSYEGFDNF